jgi:hypothetical protein
LSAAKRDPLISEPDQSYEKRHLKLQQREASAGEWYVFAVNLAALHRLARNRSEYTHSYSHRFASFDSFNSFSVDTFDYWRASPENSATYGSPGLACSVPYG